MEDLPIEFAARKAVLSAADRAGIEFATQCDLSLAAQPIYKIMPNVRELADRRVERPIPPRNGQ